MLSLTFAMFLGAAFAIIPAYVLGVNDGRRMARKELKD